MCYANNVFAVFLFVSEQGRRNDLSKLKDGFVPPEHCRRNDLLKLKVGFVPQDTSILTSTKNRSSMLPNPNSTSNIISDSVHCDPLTQVTVSYGSRCHTDDTLKERKDTVAREPCSLPFSFSSPPPHGCILSPSLVQTPPSAPSVLPSVVM